MAWTQEGCPNDWYQIGTSCYLVETSGKTMINALAHCFNLGSGSRLTWVETQQKMCDVAHLVDQVSSVDLAWVAGMSWSGALKWVWTTDGTPGGTQLGKSDSTKVHYAIKTKSL